ncbi:MULTISPECIES: acyl-CoA dehydrogenase family protein [unclassified Sphingomonas]|uniref:acyl-CoA dehydrogenase family protein n=1 Tax=unclassified Sphingomonas TaxID=196159 RepID=UPI0006FD7611|nr:MULTISPECIES: acyl-CoA dehydrogenase family protein [unclassified Sphingomonas]KQX18592.1 acyl-CoA dehydrogenase [Sphingomonas sp. Root1294]KQY72084.1 acyl-CoA dehydrogenase [Sphingomonas sp. Root50]KRB94646.1 acyl-CoA dehydrogenase [Sphingomonas sp. Root720]
MLNGFLPAEIPPEDEALRAPVRSFLERESANFPPEVRARSWLGHDAAFSRRLATQGWIGITLPASHGGGGRSQFARFVLLEEILAAGAPVAAHWLAERQSAPMILRYGTEEQKRRIVPAICRGEAFFCVGMSEPGSGSDLASVTSRAEKTARGWRLEGSKIWTTYAQSADYMIALVRTSGAVGDRAKGLSQLLIPMSTPGVEVRPIRDVAGDEHFSGVHFDNVELDEDALLGQEGEGWEQVTAELAFERSGPERIYSATVLIDEWLRCVRGHGPADASDHRLIGRIAARLVTLRAMSLSTTARLQEGESPVLQASIVKDLGTSFEQSMPELIGQAMARGEEPPSDALLAVHDYISCMSPSFSLRGGTREIVRGIIARGLGLR